MPRKSTHHEELSNYGTLVRIREPTICEATPPNLVRHKMSTKKNVTSTTVSDTKSRPSTVHKDDKPDENGVWFWVNKNGFPVDEMTWSRMWDHVARIHPDGQKMVASIRGNVDLPQV